MANEIIEPDKIRANFGYVVDFPPDGDTEFVLTLEPDEDMTARLNAEEEEDDPVYHPAHYTQGTLECIDAIEGLALPFHEAQILKYITRWKFKNGVQDLKKARWYLDRLISKLEAE
jgi:hypothetical protein